RRGYQLAVHSSSTFITFLSYWERTERKRPVIMSANNLASASRHQGKERHPAESRGDSGEFQCVRLGYVLRLRARSFWLLWLWNLSNCGELVTLQYHVAELVQSRRFRKFGQRCGEFLFLTC